MYKSIDRRGGDTAKWTHKEIKFPHPTRIMSRSILGGLHFNDYASYWTYIVIIVIIMENKIFRNSVRTTWEEPTIRQFNDSWAGGRFIRSCWLPVVVGVIFFENHCFETKTDAMSELELPKVVWKLRKLKSDQQFHRFGRHRRKCFTRNNLSSIRF